MHKDSLHLTRRQLLAGAAGTLLTARYSFAAEAGEIAESAKRGRKFLVDLFDDELSLLPEFRGCERYWLFHDNYLAAHVLEASQPELGKRIRRAIASYNVTESGKIEIVGGEARRPLPFREHRLIDVRQVGDKIVKTEILGTNELRDWQEYADLLLLAAIELSRTDGEQARAWLDQAFAMWDGLGFKDRVVEHARQYAAFKCALALLAAARLDIRPEQTDAVLERLLKQQREDGGWITDYDLQGTPVGEANVETTSLAILALDALAKRS